MEIFKDILQPQILGPLTGMLAVLGWVVVSVAKRWFAHQERLERIRMGMDPDTLEQ